MLCHESGKWEKGSIRPIQFSFVIHITHVPTLIVYSTTHIAALPLLQYVCHILI